MKILVLCARVPLTSSDGEGLRIFNFSKYLATSHEIDLVCVGEHAQSELDRHRIFQRIDALTRNGPAVRISRSHRDPKGASGDGDSAESGADVTGQLERLLKARSYDVIWTSREMAGHLPRDLGTPVLIDVCDDGDSHFEHRLKEPDGRIGKLLCGIWRPVMRHDERMRFAAADACVFSNDAAAKEFRRLVPGCRAEVIEDGLDTDRASLSGWEARARQFESLLRSITLPYAARSVSQWADLRHRRRCGATRLLMIALQFPPQSQSTGRLRTTGFVRHLPAFGWLPIVVTAREAAYADRDPKTLEEVPPGTRIIRASGVDITRVVEFRGVYPRWLATPDRWNTWSIGATISCIKAAKLQRIDAIWATFPVPSALLAAWFVSRLTGLPMVVDLRDPIVYETWPENRWDRRVYAWLERRIIHAASAVILTTPRAVDLYRQRYRHLPPDRFCEIANGVDEVLDYSRKVNGTPRTSGGGITLLHSGLMEVPDRDPRGLFRALRLLIERDLLPEQPLKIVLRASGREGEFRATAEEFGVSDLIALEPRLSHKEAIAEFQAATALILFQGSSCNRQIPAKAYEYLASGRPIIGLLDPAGDTYALVSSKWGVPYCADMVDPEAIADMLRRFFEDLDANRVKIPSESMVQSYSRRSQARELASLLDGICSYGGTACRGMRSRKSSSVATS